MIRSKALYFVGQQEITGNQGFKDPRFQELMTLTGWQKGQAWCAYFAELIWDQAGQLTEYFSGSAVKTWNNFSDSGEYDCDQDPEVGSVVIWQNYSDGKAKWTGHAGIVVSIEKKRNEVITVEGNTNDNGSSEGIEAALRVRSLDFMRNTGLRMLGFIHPK